MSDASPDSASTIYKTLTWILVAALIGLYALYDWYQGTLKQGLASQNETMSETEQRLSALDAQIKSASATEQGLKDEIARLEAEAKSETDAAASKLAATRKEMEALQARYDAATQQIGQSPAEGRHKGLLDKLAE